MLAHLVSFVETGALGFMGGLIGSGFDFDKFSQRMVAKRIDRPADELSATLRDRATTSAPLPGFPEGLTVSDVAIHTQDVRRPLGLAGSLDDEVLRHTLDFLTTAKQATTLVDRPDLDDLALRATDIDWSYGSGEEINGPAESILMALANRPVLGELAGAGVERWRQAG